MRRNTLIIVFSALVAALLLYIGFHRRTLSDGFDYPAMPEQSFAVAGESLTVFSGTGLYLYSKNGDMLLNLELSMEEPCASSCGEYCLIWDRGGEDWLLISDDGRYEKGLAGGRLDFAELGESGMLLCTEAGGGIAGVTLLNKNGERVFSYTFPAEGKVAASLSPDGKTLSVLTAGQLAFVSAENGKTLSELCISAKDMHWFGNNKLALIGDTTVYISDSGGDIDKCEVGQKIGDCAFGDDYIVLFAQRHKSGGGGELISLSTALKQIGRTETEAPVSIDIGGMGLLVQERERTLLYGKDMKIKDAAEVNSAVAALFTDSDALIIQKAHIYLW